MNHKKELLRSLWVLSKTKASKPIITSLGQESRKEGLRSGETGIGVEGYS